MSDKSNNQGRAYEFVCLLSLGEEIGKFRPVNIVQTVVIWQQNMLGIPCLLK